MGFPALQAPAAPRISGVGPQAYTQNLTAGLSFVAAVSRSLAKSFTATLSSIATLIKNYLGIGFTATLSFIGDFAVSKIFVRVLAATLSFSAAFSHIMAKALTATLTSTSAFTKQIVRGGFSVTLSFVGGFSKTLLFLRSNFSATLFSPGTGTTGVMDSYSESNATATIHIAAGDESIGVGQCFTGNGAKIIDAKFYLQRHSNPTGNAVARIYTMTGTFGVNGNVGTLLATSDGVDVTTLGNGVPGLITFTFTGAQQYTTTNGTHYVVTCEFTGGNTSNYVEIFYDGTSATHPGTWTFTTDLITWTPTDAGIDICFYVDGVVGNPAAMLTKSTGKSLSAILSFVGTLTKLIGSGFTAILSFIGSLAVSRSLLRTFTATLSFSGSLIRQIGKILLAGLSFIGNLAASFAGHRYLQAVTGTLPFTGTGGTGVIDSYSETNQNNVISIVHGSNIGFGQCFTGDGTKIINAKWFIRKDGSITGNAFAKIYTMTGTFGVNGNVGTLLATSDAFDVSTLTAVLTVTTFTFSGANQYVTTNGAHYVVTIEYDGGSPGNDIGLGYDDSSPTHPGTWAFTTDLITWTPADAGIDFCFYVDGISGGSIATLTKRTARSLGATLSFIGNLVTSFIGRLFTQTLAGILSFVGAIKKQSGIANTATLSFNPAGGTIYNSNGTPSNIQSIHDTAQDGDTITLPAGSFGWSTTLSLTKAIKLQGQGSGRIIGWSKSSVTFGTGTKTLTVQSGFTVANGTTLRIWQTATDKGTAYMLGTVTSVSGTTLTMSITTNTGSGTFVAWLIATEYSTRVVHNAGTNTLITAFESIAGSLNISGIQFTSGTGTSHTIELVFTSGGKPILIHDCWFNQSTDGVDPGGVQGTIQNQSTNRGVIWNCSADWTYFGSANSAFLHMTFNSNVAVWTALSTMGTADTDGTANFYIEDCDFHGTNAVTDADNNIKIVVRHCVFDNAQFNSHGYDTSPYGVRHWELYNNKFLFTDQGPASFNLIQFIMCRGGTGVITDNSFEDINSGAYGDKAEITFAIFCLGDWIESPGAYSANDGGLVQYPAPRQFGFGYITGLGVDGQGFTTRHGVYVGDSEPAYVWNNTGFTPVIGIVTNNAASWVMDDPAAYIQAGRDYFLTAKSGYTKYTYPHPLTTAVGFVGVSLTKKSLKALAATTLIAASLIKGMSRVFTAAVSFIGVFSKRALALRTGTLSFIGTFKRFITQVLAAATLSFTTLFNVFKIGGPQLYQQTLAGVLSFSGLMLRRSTRLLFAAQSFSGAVLRRFPPRLFSASVSFIGNHSRALLNALQFSGAISFVGNVARSMPARLSSILSFQGNLFRQLPKLLQSTLAFIGNIVGHFVVRNQLLFTSTLFFSTKIFNRIGNFLRIILGIPTPVQIKISLQQEQTIIKIAVPGDIDI